MPGAVSDEAAGAPPPRRPKPSILPSKLTLLLFGDGFSADIGVNRCLPPMIEPIDEDHPGRALQQLMDIHGIDRRQLHLATGMDIMRVYNLLRGLRSITPDTALRLGTFFEQDPHYWLRLQATYDLKQLDHYAVTRDIDPVSSNRWQQFPRQRRSAGAK